MYANNVDGQANRMLPRFLCFDVGEPVADISFDFIFMTTNLRLLRRDPKQDIYGKKSLDDMVIAELFIIFNFPPMSFALP